jgi:hypothetical protein
MPKDEAQRLRRIAAEADAAERRRKQKELEDAGNHQAVVSGIEAEREAEKAAREAAEAKADARVEELERNTTATTVASRLKFNDPADALLHLPANTSNDEASIEKALKKVAEEKAYLVNGQGGRTGAPGGGGTPPAPTDIDTAIAKAEADGDVALSTRLKRQKHFSASK